MGLLNRETRRFYGAACGSWRCGKCAPVKRRQSIRRLGLGLSEPGRARFLTLTCPPGESLVESLSRASRRFEYLRTLYRRSTGHRLAYYGVVERGSRGSRRLHLHVVLRGGPYVHQSEWSRMAERAGFGRVVDIRAVRGDVTGYVTKSLAGYLTKAACESWPPHTRRVRVSRDWAPLWVVRRPSTGGRWSFVGMRSEWTPEAWVALLAEEARADEYAERQVKAAEGP